jgi:phage-related protein
MTDREIKLLDQAYKDARLAARNSQASAKIQLDRIKKFSKDLAKGTPEEIVKNTKSYTAQFLKKELS